MAGETHRPVSRTTTEAGLGQSEQEAEAERAGCWGQLSRQAGTASGEQPQGHAPC